MVSPDNISINLVRGDPKQRVNLDLDIELYKDAVKYRDDLFYQKKMSGHARFKGNKLATAGRVLLNKLVNKTYEENKYITPCYAGNLSGVMYPEGNIYPCEILDDTHKIGNIRDFNEDTNLFIYPGFEFNVINKLITNFHLPKSSLFILVSAFFGKNKTREVYEFAVKNDMRFFSFGDAMLLDKNEF